MKSHQLDQNHEHAMVVVDMTVMERPQEVATEVDEAGGMEGMI